jgi:hypothetical protein
MLAGGVLEVFLLRESVRGGKQGFKFLSDEVGDVTMSFMILTASPIELAWNPIWFMPLIRSSTVIGRPANLLKSNSSTF